VDNPLNLYSLDISRLSIFATHEGRLHVYSKWCRFEIPLVLGLSPGTVRARRRPRSYITHVPDARLGPVLRREFALVENGLWRGMTILVIQ
jgi:hypothetical protein